MIQITCKGNSAICTRAARLTSGMVGLQCEFVFDGAWDGLAKTAVFTAGNEKRDVLLQGAICTVPWEVLKTAGYQLVIGVYGTNADGTLVIPTVYAMCGGIASGADPSGEESTDPTLPVWGQLQGMIGNLGNLSTASKDNLVSAINEAAQSGGGGGSAVALDTTLTQSGKAADAKAVGDALADKQPKGDYLTQNELPDMTAYRTAEAQDAIDAGKQATLIQSGAAVGQIAKITAVDDSGKPTAWAAVDMPSGGERWRLVRTITLEKNVTSIDISEDNDGNHFALKKIRIFGNTLGTASGGQLRINVANGNDDKHSILGPYTNFKGLDTAKRYWYAESEYLGIIGDKGKWFGRYNTPDNTGAGVAYAGANLRSPILNSGRYIQDRVEFLHIFSNTSGVEFAAGSYIELWGVDA